MTYTQVAARYDYGIRKGPVKAFLVHMAEGAGTVGYLARDPLRGVSVHYVIETSGRIVQMLPESHASGSVNPNDLRTTNDADGFYGVTAARAVMAEWWRDPNAAVISLEIEGFAAAGPNSDQAQSLVRLVNDVRTRHAAMGLLGHRDFADYKACPGRHINWAALGGHGVHTTPPEEDMPGLGIRSAITADTNPYDALGTTSINSLDTHSIIRARDRAYIKVAANKPLGIVTKATLIEPLDTHAGDRSSVYEFNYDDGKTNEKHVALVMDCTPFVPAKSPADTTPITQAAYDAVLAKVTAARGVALEEARDAAIKGAGAAVDALPR